MNYSNNKFFILFLLLGSGVAGFLFSLFVHCGTQEAPVRETVHYPISFVEQLGSGPDVGRKIFNEFCVACHGVSPVIDVHAPTINDKRTWRQRSSLGADVLLQHTLQGKGAMPARGGCFECSDEQLQAAIEYILNANF